MSKLPYTSPVRVRRRRALALAFTVFMAYALAEPLWRGYLALGLSREDGAVFWVLTSGFVFIYAVFVALAALLNRWATFLSPSDKAVLATSFAGGMVVGTVVTNSITAAHHRYES